MQTNLSQPRIAVLIKQVPARADAQTDPVHGTLLRVPGAGMLNPYDYAAIAAALAVAKALDCGTTAFSMGPACAKQALYEALALGVTDAVLLCDSAFAGADVFATAFTLARALELAGGFSYIFCGQQTTDGDTAQLPFSLAAQTALPAYGWVKALRVKKNALELTQEYSGGTRKLLAAAPCVLAMQPESYPKQEATLALRLQAGKKHITQLNRTNLGESAHYGLSGSPTRVKRLYRTEQPRRAARLVLPPKQAAAHILAEIRAAQTIGTRNEPKPRASAFPPAQIRGQDAPSPPLAAPYTAQEARQSVLVFLQPHEKGLHPASAELAQQAVFLAKQGDAQAFGCAAIPALTPRLRRELEDVPLTWVDAYRTNASPATAPPEQDWQLCMLDCILKHKPGSVLIAATPEGRAIAPFLGAVQQTGVTADCTALSLLPDGALLQTRPAFGGDKMAEILTPLARPQIATVRRGALEGAVAPQMQERDIWVVAGGGVSDPERLSALQSFARQAGFLFGGSRALVERGLLPQSKQIGLSGKSIAPALLLCVGVSGSVQFLAGIHAAKRVVAINADENAPILRRANLPLVGDYEPIIEGLFTQIQSR